MILDYEIHNLIFARPNGRMCGLAPRPNGRMCGLAPRPNGRMCGLAPSNLIQFLIYSFYVKFTDLCYYYLNTMFQS